MNGPDSSLGPPQHLCQVSVLQPPASSPSAVLQAATVQEVVPFLLGLNSPNPPFDPFLYDPNGLLSLQRDAHISFLNEALADYPGSFVTLDASRPWMIYWALSGLHFLGEDLSSYRDRIVKSFVPLQNSSGGYAGGEGHLSHLACTYPTILSLAIAGGEDAWRLTDRKAMWEWLGRLKQADGGFAICEGGEQDCRGAYCALVTIALLDLPWELPPSSPARQAGLRTFADGLGDWLGLCQTYEGGISASPGSEAHGAYTFCAVACLCLLGSPHITLTRWLDLDALIAWLSARQHAPEGGLAGRTNKVVDGCYSQWIGGCWPLVQAALDGPRPSGQGRGRAVGNLFSVEGLARYILNCCQNPDGGLRDKPSKRPDSYHSCYTLAGISTMEHDHYFTGGAHASRLDSSFTWKAVQCQTKEAETHRRTTELQDLEFDIGCRVGAVNPVYVIPHGSVSAMRSWSEQQDRIS